MVPTETRWVGLKETPVLIGTALHSTEYESKEEKDVGEEDERRRQERSRVVLSDEMVALHLPDEVRLTLDVRKSVAVNGTDKKQLSKSREAKLCFHRMLQCVGHNAEYPAEFFRSVFFECNNNSTLKIILKFSPQCFQSLI